MTTWTNIAAPVRAAAPDGFIADNTGDGFYTPPRGDGFYAPDGDWTPVVIADGSVTPGGSD